MIRCLRMYLVNLKQKKGEKGIDFFQASLLGVVFWVVPGFSMFFLLPEGEKP